MHFAKASGSSSCSLDPGNKFPKNSYSSIVSLTGELHVGLEVSMAALDGSSREHVGEACSEGPRIRFEVLS